MLVVLEASAILVGFCKMFGVQMGPGEPTDKLLANSTERLHVHKKLECALIRGATTN